MIEMGALLLCIKFALSLRFKMMLVENHQSAAAIGEDLEIDLVNSLFLY
jgi:hypothetical protein